MTTETLTKLLAVYAADRRQTRTCIRCPESDYFLFDVSKKAGIEIRMAECLNGHVLYYVAIPAIETEAGRQAFAKIVNACGGLTVSVYAFKPRRDGRTYRDSKTGEYVELVAEMFVSAYLT